MNAWLGDTLPDVTSGSSGRSGTKTVEPLLTVWSTPWSKNCPKNVKIELNGGDRPTSVVTFGMKSVLCAGVQKSGLPFGSAGPGSPPGAHGSELAVGSWVRTGCPAAAIAAGFSEVWSTIRLLMMRGCESMTSPFLELYFVGPVAGVPGETGKP